MDINEFRFRTLLGTRSIQVPSMLFIAPPLFNHGPIDLWWMGIKQFLTLLVQHFDWLYLRVAYNPLVCRCMMMYADIFTMNM